MADPAGPFGFGYTGDGKWMIVRPGIQTDHIMFTNPTASPGATTGLALDGSNRLVVKTIPAAYGDTNGPASATDEALARFDGTTGKLVQNSLVTLSDTGNMTFTAPAVGVLSLAAGSASGVTFPTPAGAPAPTTTQLSVYARRTAAAVTWTGPYTAPVAGTIAIDRAGNQVALAISTVSSAGTNTFSGPIVLSAPLPAWAIPASNKTCIMRIRSGVAGTYSALGALTVTTAGVISVAQSYSNLAAGFSVTAGDIVGFGYDETSVQTIVTYTL